MPDGLVDDRWGVPVHGVLTREYQDVDAVQDEVFEATRGLGLSFGCNVDESAEHALDGAVVLDPGVTSGSVAVLSFPLRPGAARD